jgi:hypothetical protein
MKNYILLSLIVLFGINAEAFAQKITYHPDKKPTKAEQSLDASLKACITENQLPEGFSISEWSALLHYYNYKMIQRLSSENANEIANQRKVVFALADMAQSCPPLQKVQKELTAIKKIYEKKISDESNEANSGMFEDDERKVKMDKGDAEDLIKYLDKIRESLQITRVITRIQN